MRTKDKDLLRDIRRYIDDYCDSNGCGPSVREVAAEFGISSSGAQRYIAQLAADGQIAQARKGGYESRAMASSRPTQSIPILGAVPCGPLAVVEEFIEGYVRLPASMVGSGNYYFLTANGDSMIGAGIEDGDLVLIREAQQAHIGDIVVALVENEVTLKRLQRDDEGRVYLHPENEEMDDIYVDTIEVQGVAVKALKDLT